jgi:hypothetical protein
MGAVALRRKPETALSAGKQRTAPDLTVFEYRRAAIRWSRKSGRL